MDEYLLPHPEIPAEVMATLHPWLQAIATSDLDQIRTMLEERLEALPPELMSTCEKILTYRPASILFEPERALLRMVPPDSESGSPDLHLLPPKGEALFQGINPWISLPLIELRFGELRGLLNFPVPVPVDPPPPLRPTETEYALPHPEIPEPIHPWLRSVASADLPGIKLLLEERFAEVAEPELGLLRNQLLSYQPVSIATFRENAFLKLTGPLEYGFAYLPAPADASDIQSRLDAAGMNADPLFRSFMIHFAGLAESIDSAGIFAGCSNPWQTMKEEWQREALPDFPAWEGALMFYHARNGDQLLIHPGGKVGWWKLAERRIEHAYDSFADFLRFYVDFRARTSWPLDSYGPSDDLEVG